MTVTTHTDRLPDRIAVIADVHGNSDALRAVMADVSAQEAGALLVLGDHFSGPLDAAGTATILLGHRGIPMLALRGNHDRYLLEQTPERMGPSDRVALAALDAPAMAWVRALPAMLDLGDVVACHGVPQDDQTYWMQRVTDAGEVVARPRAEVEAFAAGIAAPLILCAHTHLPGAVRLSGGRLLVNPGSVGCPGYTDDAPVPHVVQTGTPDAAYAVCDRTRGGWRVTFRQVPYDPGAMVARAQAEGRDDWARAVGTGWIAG